MYYPCSVIPSDRLTRVRNDQLYACDEWGEILGPIKCWQKDCPCVVDCAIFESHPSDKFFRCSGKAIGIDWKYAIKNKDRQIQEEKDQIKELNKELDEKAKTIGSLSKELYELRVKNGKLEAAKERKERKPRTKKEVP